MDAQKRIQRTFWNSTTLTLTSTAAAGEEVNVFFVPSVPSGTDETLNV